MAVGLEAESRIRCCVLLAPVTVSSIHGSDAFAKQVLQHVLGDLLLAAGTSQVALVVKNSPANAGDMRDTGSIPGSGRSPRGGHGNPLQYPCLENAMDRGAWWATVHRLAESQTRLKQHSTHVCFWLQNLELGSLALPRII